MQTIVVAARKGGSGKTTLTAHLAVAAGRKGPKRTAVLDLDPQGSLVHWWNQRCADQPFYLRTGIERLSEDQARLADAGVDLLIIDTPPAYTAALNRVLRHADLVVIPCRPSPHDLRSIGATVAQCEALGKPFVLVLNAATWRTRMTAEAAALLKECGPLSTAVLHNRVDMAACMVGGSTVLEEKPHGKASDELGALWLDIAERLEGLAGRALPGLPEAALAPTEAAPLFADQTAV